jgi:hypothetical protein
MARTFDESLRSYYIVRGTCKYKWLTMGANPQQDYDKTFVWYLPDTRKPNGCDLIPIKSG